MSPLALVYYSNLNIKITLYEIGFILKKRSLNISSSYNSRISLALPGSALVNEFLMIVLRFIAIIQSLFHFDIFAINKFHIPVFKCYLASIFLTKSLSCLLFLSVFDGMFQTNFYMFVITFIVVMYLI